MFTEVSLPSRETFHCKGQGPGEGPQRRGHRSELKDCFRVIKMKKMEGQQRRQSLQRPGARVSSLLGNALQGAITYDHLTVRGGALSRHSRKRTLRLCKQACLDPRCKTITEHCRTQFSSLLSLFPPLGCLFFSSFIEEQLTNLFVYI